LAVYGFCPCMSGWPAATCPECRMAFRSKKRFGRYWFPASAGEEMFDIVNREYEENGSFRCDFFRNERT